MHIIGRVKLVPWKLGEKRVLAWRRRKQMGVSI